MPQPLDPVIAKKIRKYLPDLTDEEARDVCWLLDRGGRSQWLMKHKWVERLGYEAGVEMIAVEWISVQHKDGYVACQVRAELDGSVAITTGEASPANNKTSYPFAMAEKRAVDRAILKLVGLHGDVYSDADDFEEQDAPTKTGELFSDAPREKRPGRMKKPTPQELREYSREKGLPDCSQSFLDYYEANGWKVGRNPMKSWQHAYSRWCNNDKGTRRDTTMRGGLESMRPIVDRVEDGIVYRRS